MSRRLRYQVAVSLDGFIAGPNGEYDWIVMDRAIDFAALFKEFDTAVMGRKTYEMMTAQGGHGAMPGLDVIVFSRTLPAATYRGVRIFNDDAAAIVPGLKAKPGRDIWLFGGGGLFRSLLDAGLVDSVEVAVMPVSPADPLLPAGAATTLVLADQKTPGQRDRCARIRCPEGLALPRIRSSRRQDSGEKVRAPANCPANGGQETAREEGRLDRLLLASLQLRIHHADKSIGARPAAPAGGVRPAPRT